MSSRRRRSTKAFSLTSSSPAQSGREADLIICVGGDGTVLYAASQFPRNMPPTLCFAMGSLGFLTTFSVVEAMTSAIPASSGHPTPAEQDCEPTIWTRQSNPWTTNNTNVLLCWVRIMVEIPYGRTDPYGKLRPHGSVPWYRTEKLHSNSIRGSGSFGGRLWIFSCEILRNARNQP